MKEEDDYLKNKIEKEYDNNERSFKNYKPN